jgi:hypothetical protein
MKTTLLAVGVILYAVATFPPMDRQFERCRADWLAAFKPTFEKPISVLSADYQFLRACMASKGFNPKAEPCDGGAAMTWSNCYVRRLPWE